MPVEPPPPRYSLWIVPPHPLRDGLIQTISEFAHQLGIPPFEPHVTLLGDLACSLEEAREGLRRIGEAARSFAVDFEGIDSGDTFHRAVYLRVRRSEGVIQARKTAERFLGDRAAETEPFEPHLSLAYGILDEETRRRIREETRGRGLHSGSFVARRLTLAESASEVPIERWRLVEAVELASPRAG